MSVTGNSDTGKYLVFLERDEKGYNVINLLEYKNIIDMRDYSLKNERIKENVRTKLNIYINNYKNNNDKESKRKNKILDEMANPNNNKSRHFLIDFDSKSDILLPSIVYQFNDSLNITLIPIEIDSDKNYVIKHTYNIPKKDYKTYFESRKNLIQGFQSNLIIRNVNFDKENIFNAIKDDIKSKTISSTNIKNIVFSDDSNYDFCGYSLEKVNNMIKITSDCFENITSKTPVTNNLYPENTNNLSYQERSLHQKTTHQLNQLKNEQLGSPTAKSDPGTTSNPVINNNSRNVSSAPLISNTGNNKTQKKKPFR